MAYFNLNNKRTEKLLREQTKFNLDIGSTPEELKEISYKFYLQNLENKEYNTSRTFPKTIPDLNFGEVAILEKRYFSESTEDLKAKMEIQSDFLNQQEEEIKNSLQRRREVSQVEDIQKLFDSGLLPDKTDFFSEENQDYIRSLKASGRYQEVIKDKRLEQQNNRRDEKERKLEEKLSVVINTLLRENNPEIINTTISNAVTTEVSKLFSNLTERQQLTLSRKVLDQAKAELERLKQRDIRDAVGGSGGAGSGTGKGDITSIQRRDELIARIDHLKQERRQIGSNNDIKYINRKKERGDKLSENEEERLVLYRDLSQTIKDLEQSLARFPF